MTLLDVSAPAKLILFGEWAVLEGAPGIGIALSPRFRVSVSDPDETLMGGLEILTGARSFKPKSFDENPPDSYFLPVWRAFKALAPRQELSRIYQGRRIELSCQWRAEEGLGSSSALCTTLLASHMRLNHQTPEFRGADFFEQAKALHRTALDSHGSGLDVAIQCWGGTVILEQGIVTELVLGVPENFVIIHTGKKISTSETIAKGAGPKGPQLRQIEDSTRRFLKSLDFLQAMNEHLEAQLSASLMPADIQLELNKLKKDGLILAFKTSGAGGGDAILALAQMERLEELKSKVSHLKWWISDAVYSTRGLEWSET